MPQSYQSSNDSHYPYSRYLTETFGGKTYKVVVSSGLTCPTRDGSLGPQKGCAFCDVRGSSSYFGKQGRGLDVTSQLRKRMPAIRERFGVDRFLAYFQSYTNTYAASSRDGDYDTSYLREIYEAALAEPGIVGLCIGTRPDCLPPSVLKLLQEIAERSYVSLELGVQSFHDPTLEWMVRGHDRACSIDALERIRSEAPSVHTCAHLMFGCPTEPQGLAVETAELLNGLGVRGVKLHQLMILENTDLARRFREEPFPTISLEAYSELTAEFIARLSPSIYVERLCATATHFEECLAPEWSRSRWEPHNRIRDLLNTRGIRQGMKLAPEPVVARV